ncbi:MAG: leucine-rich repeat protein [Clostridia bacterium]|nr:leucine-rich repeat protein [Clostridia bacterium]
MLKKLLTSFIIAIVVLVAASCVDNHSHAELFCVTFCGENISEYNVTVQKDSTAAEPKAPQSEGKEFLYWATEDGNRFDFSSPITGDVRLYAVWKGTNSGESNKEEKVYFAVRFFGVSGELISVQRVEEGKSAKTPAVCTDEFFVFDGWDKDVSKVLCDMDVYASQRYNSMDASLFTYEERGGEYTITGVREGVSLPQMAGGYVNLALPTEYQGLPVTAIKDGDHNNGVFSRYNILSLYVPSCYKTIGDYAFYGNPFLSRVIFNEGLQEIGEGAFMATLGEGFTLTGRDYVNSGADVYVSALTQIKLPSTLTTIDDYAFSHVGRMFAGSNYVIIEVELTFATDSKLTVIGDYAFEGVQIRNINLPNGLASIGDGAFAADMYLNWVMMGSYDFPRSITTTVSLPGSVRYIGNGAFFGLGVMSQYYLGNCYMSYSDVRFNAGRLTLDYLGDYAFCGASLIGTLEIAVQKINDYAFCGQAFSAIYLEGVEEIGECSFERADVSPALTLSLGQDLTLIGDYAFYGSVGLSSLTLPSTLTQIGDYAFYGSASLSGEVVFPASLLSVGECAFASSGIDSVKIKGSVVLKSECFKDSDLTVVVGNIKSVSDGTFAGCAQLQSVSLPGDMTHLPQKLFYGCKNLQQITLPDSIEEIECSAFASCASLTEISLPQSLKTLGCHAFEGCSALAEVTVDCDLQSVKEGAFAYCCKLGSIKLPDSVREIGDYAFRGTALTSFTTPASLEVMGQRVFYREQYVATKVNKISPFGVDTVSKVTMPTISEFTVGKNTGSIQFDIGTFEGSKVCGFAVEDGNDYYTVCNGVLYSADGLTLIMYSRDESAANVKVAEGVQHIASGAFYGNTYLTSVTLPSTLLSIGNYAFYGASSLKAIDFSAANRLTLIGNYAFSGSVGSAPKVTSLDFSGCTSLESTGERAFAYCEQLKNIDFGTLTKVDKNSFYGCGALVNVILGKSLTTIGEGAFRCCTSLTNIVLPVDSMLTTVGAYAFAGTISQKANYDVLDLSNATKLQLIDDSAFAYGNVKRVILPKSEFVLGDDAFSGCNLLNAVELGKCVSIGQNAFRYCLSLCEITIPSSVKIISKEAFRDLNLITVNIGTEECGNSLDSIGKYAFFGCNLLTTVNIYGDSAPTLVGEEDNLLFHYIDPNGTTAVISRLNIFVDEGSLPRYGANGWQIYQNLIFERN